MSEPASASPGRGRAHREAAVRAALDPARPRDAARTAAYAARHGVDETAVPAHLAGRFAAFEEAVDRILALATHTTPDRQLVLRDALDALRAPYGRAMGEALELLGDATGDPAG